MNKIKINIKRLLYKIRYNLMTPQNIVLAIALVIAAGWVWGSLNMMTRNYQLQHQLSDRKRQLALTQIDVDNMRLAQKYYKTEEFLELSARESLNVVKPGEKVLLLEPAPPEALEKDAKNAHKAREKTANQRGSNLDQWINFLFGGNRPT